MNARQPVGTYILATVVLTVGLAFGVALRFANDHAPSRAARSTMVAPGCAVVDLDNHRHARILDHAWDAIDHGKPVVLHIDRGHAAAHRAAWHRAQGARFPTRPGFDRDEYPPAMSREGGARTDLRYVRSAENRSAGSVMGRELEDEPDGACFQYEPRP